MKKTSVGIVVAASLLLGGCGTLLSGPALISMATSLIGGVANGAIFGGSVVGALKTAADGAAENKEVGVTAAPEVEGPTRPASLADSR
jgi:hypothetical protein